MIKLTDMLNMTPEQKKAAKVKFNIYNGYDNPIELYKRTPELINKQWLYWRNKNRYFNVGQIAICLVRIRDDKWLLTTIDTVDSEFGVTNEINYSGTPFQEYKEYYGRTIIKYHKSLRSECLYLKNIEDDLEVSQILPDTFDDDDFPGYDKVKLTYTKLKSILERGKKDWVAALKNQKAVYLITDKRNGKLYVGSATSDKGMLLQRWSNYVTNGHGGNKELKEIVNSCGIEYIKSNFQYSILENYNAKIDDSIILERESWWKEVLLSRIPYGYNAN